MKNILTLFGVAVVVAFVYASAWFFGVSPKVTMLTLAVVTAFVAVMVSAIATAVSSKKVAYVASVVLVAATASTAVSGVVVVGLDTKIVVWVAICASASVASITGVDIAYGKGNWTSWGVSRIFFMEAVAIFFPVFLHLN